MTGTHGPPGAMAMQAVSNAMVSLHKEQFGRGPTNARTHFAGADPLVCTIEEALLPAERTMVQMGEHNRVREARMFLQVATSREFIGAGAAIIPRKVRGFASAIDPEPGIVWEIFTFESAERDGHGPAG